MDFTSAATMSVIAGYLKEQWVADYIVSQYGRDRVAMALLEKNSKIVRGLKAVATVRLGPNTSTGPRAEMGSLPNPKAQTTKQVEVPLSFWYTTVAFSGPAMFASRDNANALASVVTDELDNAIEDHKKVENAFFHGDGSGVLAQQTGAAAGNVITLTNWHPCLQVGRLVDSFTAKTGGSQHLDSQAITAVDRANKTITVANAANAASGDYFFLEDSRGNANAGFLSIADNGGYVPTFQGLLRSSYPNWNGKVFTATDYRDISEDLCSSIIARMREDGAKPDLILGTSFQLKDLCKEAKEQRRFLDPKTSVDLGISGIKIGDGVDFVWDADAVAGLTLFLTKKDIMIAEAAPLGFMEADGNVLVRIQGKDGYEADLFHYFNLIALACYNQARAEKINENRIDG